MPMLNLNLRNNAPVVVVVVRRLRQAREDVSAALLESGFLMFFTAAHAAASSSPPEESVLAYPGVRRGAIAGSAIIGLGNMSAAVWVAADPARRRGTGWNILCASLVAMMVIAFYLVNEFDVFFDILREIA